MAMKEKERERLLRYEAQLIADRHGKSMADALIIARAAAAAKAAEHKAKRSALMNEKKLRAERRHDLRKKGATVFKPHGPPVSGGLPGQGKRK